VVVDVVDVVVVVVDEVVGGCVDRATKK